MILRRPAVLMAIGVIATLVLAIAVVRVLLLTGDGNALSDNAALIAAVVALGSVFTAQMVGIALEAQRAREAALQNYLQQVGKLLIEQPLHRASPGDNLSTVVRAQTLSVLEGLDADRQRLLLLFLYESGLILKNKRVVRLELANLSAAKLGRTFLISANLSGTDLSKVNLDKAHLHRADLSGTKLYRASLIGTDLVEADLRGPT